MEESRELAAAFASGEGWAYEAAYRLHGTLLRTAAQNVLRDAGDAQDCVHDVLTRLWQRKGAFRVERGSLRAFLAVCVRNEALTRARNAANRERIVARMVPPPNERDPSEGIVEREAVVHAMQVLNEKERVTITLAYYSGLTHEQIAAQTGEPLGTVKGRLSGALRRLREFFAAEESSRV